MRKNLNRVLIGIVSFSMLFDSMATIAYGNDFSIEESYYETDDTYADMEIVEDAETEEKTFDSESEPVDSEEPQADLDENEIVESAQEEDTNADDELLFDESFDDFQNIEFESTAESEENWMDSFEFPDMSAEIAALNAASGNGKKKAARRAASAQSASSTMTLDTFDLDVYRANILANESTFSGMIDRYMAIDTPAETLVNELSLNDGFMAGVIGWETTTFNPSDYAEDILIDPIQYYEITLLNMLNSASYSNSYLSALTDGSNKRTLSLLKACMKWLKEDYKIDFEAGVDSPEMIRRITALMKSEDSFDWSMENRNRLYEEVQKEYTTLFGVDGTDHGGISGWVDGISEVMSGASTVYDSLKKAAAYSSLLETSANMVSVLNYMDQQEAAGRNNLYLRAAFANVLSACDGTMAGFAMETIKSMGNVLYKKLMGELWNKLVASAGGSWILIGQSLGKSISNIMFSTDKTIEQFYQMRAYTEILSLSRSSVSYFRNQFRNNPCAQTASEYLGAVSLFFDTAKIGCDHAKDFADTVYTQGVWNTITNSKQNEQYLKFIGQCDSIKESFQFTQDQLLNQVWKSYLSNEHPAIYAILNEDYDGTYAYVPVSEIKMSEQEVEWGLNSYTCIVQAVVLPDNATDKSVTYQSSDESIVTVDNDGWCTPHKTGTATITATSNDGGLTAVTEVTIVEEEISLGGETTESFSYEGYGEGIRLTKYLGNSKHVRIPGEIGGKTVIAIGDSCFKDNLILEQVIIPDSVSEIGSYAFYNCTSLLNIDISIYVKYFGYSAFGGCTGIKKVTIPIDVDYTINAPFVGCNAIESIVYIPGNTGVAVPYSNQNGRMEWYSGKSIQTITYEEGIADIGNYAVNVDTSNYFYYVSEDQPNDLNPQKVYLPDTLETIGNYAFNGKSCEIIGGMSSVKNIGEYAFEKFDGKISGSLDNVESVGMYAFAGCTGIQLTKLPPKMRNYSNYSFSEFPGIPERVNITDEMNFGSCVFENCINIKEVEIEGHQDIGISTFSGCTGIKKVTIPIDLDYTTYAPFTGCNAIESIIYTSGNTGVAVPYSSQSGRMEWYSGKSIQTITYEEGITDIGNYAVKVDTRNYISYGPEDQPNDLNPSEINLPSTLEKIGISAFQGCSAVKRLDTTEKLTSIGNNAFSGCSNLTVYGITGSYADQYCAENKVPFVGTEKITAKVVSNSLILDGKIGVNFYVTIPENITSDPDAYAVIKFGNNSTTTKISQAEQSVSNGVLRYKFTYYVAAKEMQDILLLQIRDGKGNAVSLEDRNGNDVTDGYSYSVQTYLDAAKERGSAAIKPLATAMEDYGTCARIYLDYNASGLAASSTVTSVPPEKLNAYTASYSGTLMDGIKNTSTLILETDTTVRQYFNLPSGSRVSDYTFTVNGKKVTPEFKDKYYTAVENIAAKDLDVFQTFTISKGSTTYTIKFSALSYAQKAVNTSKPSLQNMAKSLYLYNQAAKVYFGG